MTAARLAQIRATVEAREPLTPGMARDLLAEHDRHRQARPAEERLIEDAGGELEFLRIERRRLEKVVRGLAASNLGLRAEVERLVIAREVLKMPVGLLCAPEKPPAGLSGAKRQEAGEVAHEVTDRLPCGCVMVGPSVAGRCRWHRAQ